MTDAGASPPTARIDLAAERNEILPPRDEPNASKPHVRRTLALRLVWLLAGVIGAGVLVLLVGAFTDVRDLGEIRTFVEVAFGSVLTLVSTVVGFYFGTETSSPDADSDDPTKSISV